MLNEVSRLGFLLQNSHMETLKMSSMFYSTYRPRVSSILTKFSNVAIAYSADLKQGHEYLMTLDDSGWNQANYRFTLFTELMLKVRNKRYILWLILYTGQNWLVTFGLGSCVLWNIDIHWFTICRLTQHL